MFEPRLKFKPMLKLFKFDLRNRIVYKRDCKRNSKWTFMKRWQFPIHNDTLETFLRLKKV